jgi:hypothetical protein
MAHHKLGEKSKAMECFEQAVRWQREHQSNLPADSKAELQQFRGEATSILGLDPEKEVPEVPEDPLAARR